MLDTLTPQEFDELMAADIVEPDPLERIAEILKLGFAMESAMWGGKLKPDIFEPKYELVTSDSSVVAKGNGEEALSPNQGAAFAAMAFGRPPDNQRR